jgi:hypothetical protein
MIWGVYVGLRAKDINPFFREQIIPMPFIIVAIGSPNTLKSHEDRSGIIVAGRHW